MSKAHASNEKAKETHPGVSPEKTKGSHAPHQATHDTEHPPHTGEAKKSDHKKAEAPPLTPRSKIHNVLPGGCHAWSCKTQATRFNFCDEHYDHFKFGLIKKTGEPVSDYEKKIEHYMAHKAKKVVQKVA